MHHTKVIALYAPSGGGKTTIAGDLQSRVPNAGALYFDDRDYDAESGIGAIGEWVEEGGDVNRFQLQSLADEIEAMQQEKRDFIFLDYPFGYRHKLIAPYITLSVFIDTPLDIAMARRILRDYKKDTASAILDEMESYLQGGRSAYLYGDKAARADADFIADGSLPIAVISRKIREKIGLI